MSRSYFNESHKMYRVKNVPKWTWDEQTQMQEILFNKGFLVSTVSRVGCDRKYHDAWQVQRTDVPQLIEELFRQRFTVEVQSEGSYKASINFCYDYPGESVISAVKRFRKNKLNGGKL